MKQKIAIIGKGSVAVCLNGVWNRLVMKFAAVKEKQSGKRLTGAKS